MPTYDYACEACGHRFEHLQSITEKALKKCPECGRAKLRRLIGAGAGFIFKGSGFYITDYRSQAYKDKADKDKPDAPKAAGDAAPAAAAPDPASAPEKPAKPAPAPAPAPAKAKPAKKAPKAG